MVAARGSLGHQAALTFLLFAPAVTVRQYVGTSAYLGASTIIDDKAVLISAGQSSSSSARSTVRDGAFLTGSLRFSSHSPDPVHRGSGTSLT